MLSKSIGWSECARRAERTEGRALHQGLMALPCRPGQSFARNPSHDSFILHHKASVRSASNLEMVNLRALPPKPGPKLKTYLMIFISDHKTINGRRVAENYTTQGELERQVRCTQFTTGQKLVHKVLRIGTHNVRKFPEEFKELIALDVAPGEALHATPFLFCQLSTSLSFGSKVSGATPAILVSPSVRRQLPC